MILPSKVMTMIKVHFTYFKVFSRFMVDIPPIIRFYCLFEPILAQIRVNKNVSLDIDYPDDLAHAVAQLPVDRSETRRFLEESGIAERLVVSQCTRGTDAN